MLELEELRILLRRPGGLGELVGGLKADDDAGSRPFDLEYRISRSGDDALLLSGRHEGVDVESLANGRIGRDYLKRILRRAGCPNELKDVISHVLGR